MFNNKYSKTLSVILVIVIIAIIGLLIYFGIDVYRKFYIEEASGDAVHEFQNKVNEINNNNLVDNTVLNDVGGMDLNSLYQNTTTSGSNNSGTGVTYMGYDVIGTIEIPAIDIEYPLNVAIVMLYPSNIGLNEVGNTVLAGHNYRNGTFFSNNKRLQDGDKIYITDTSGERVEYAVTKKYETSTSDSSYMSRDTNGKRELSLTTCTDDTTRRLIIWAEEVE